MHALWVLRGVGESFFRTKTRLKRSGILQTLSSQGVGRSTQGKKKRSADEVEALEWGRLLGLDAIGWGFGISPVTGPKV